MWAKRLGKLCKGAENIVGADRVLVRVLYSDRVALSLLSAIVHCAPPRRKTLMSDDCEGLDGAGT